MAAGSHSLSCRHNNAHYLNIFCPGLLCVTRTCILWTASFHLFASIRTQAVVARTSGEVVRHVIPAKFLRVAPHGQLSLGNIVNKVGSAGFRDCGP